MDYSRFFQSLNLLVVYIYRVYQDSKARQAKETERQLNTIRIARQDRPSRQLNIIRIEGTQQGVKQVEEELKRMINKLENEKEKACIIDYKLHSQIIGPKGDSARDSGGFRRI
uniref:Vigilin n=1 Tax=Cacopsylla melanoneura TaxID=428564 RepID=A0A8D8YD65_9HEMI